MSVGKNRSSVPGSLLMGTIVFVMTLFWFICIVCPSYSFFIIHALKIPELWDIHSEILNDLFPRVESFLDKMDNAKAKHELTRTYANEDSRFYENIFTSMVKDGIIDYEKTCPGQSVTDFLANEEKRNQALQKDRESVATCDKAIADAKENKATVYQDLLYSTREDIVMRIIAILSHLYLILIGTLVAVQLLALAFFEEGDNIVYDWFGIKLAVLSIFVNLISLCQTYNWCQRQKENIEVEGRNIDDDGELRRMIWVLKVVEQHLLYFGTFHLIMTLYMFWRACFVRPRSRTACATLSIKVTEDTPAGPKKLHAYCLHGKIDQVEEIVQHSKNDIDINELKDGQTVLHLAIDKGHGRILQYLIRNFREKIDPCLRNKQQYNLLDLTIIKERKDLFDKVLDLPREPELSSLSLAVKTNQFKMVDSLVTILDKKVPSGIISDLKEYRVLRKDMSEKKMSKQARQDMTEKCDLLKSSITDRIQRISSNTVLQVQCTACKKEIRSPLQIYSCSKRHYHCSECSPKLKACPHCSENFKTVKPSRRRVLEQQLAESNNNEDH